MTSIEKREKKSIFFYSYFGGDGVLLLRCSGERKNRGISLELSLTSVFVRSVRVFSDCSRMALIVAALSKLGGGV